MITRRRALAVLGFAASGLAAPGLAHHGGESPVVGDMVLGDPEAPIKIVEYASLTCPHCASFHADVLPQIKANYIDTGKARLVYRDFPLDRSALLAAAMARCAGRDRFFGFIDVLYRTQSSWSRADNPTEALARIGRLGGLKREEIDACLADEALLDRILSARIQGRREFDIRSTPTFIVNGEKIVGAESYERFKEVLDRMLPKQ